MNLKEYLKSKGVVITHNFTSTTYENLENVLGKEVWICDYRCGDDIFKKPIRSIPPKKVKIFDADTAKKNIYYSPIYFKEIKGDKILNTEIAPCDNTGYRGRSGESVNVFDMESNCQKCYRNQLMKAKDQYDKEYSRIKKIYDDKVNWILNEVNNYNAVQNVETKGNSMVCPKCERIMNYDPYFKTHICRQCGNTENC